MESPGEMRGQSDRCMDSGRMSEAAEWYTKAAEQGYPKAQYNLGCCYDRGIGVPQSSSKVAELYRSAAEQGHADAQYNLGWDYEYGEGVPQSLEEAMKWYKMAEDQGNEDAAEALARIAAKARKRG